MCRYPAASLDLPAKPQIQPPHKHTTWALIKEGPTTSLVGGFTPDDCPSVEGKRAAGFWSLGLGGGLPFAHFVQQQRRDTASPVVAQPHDSVSQCAGSNGVREQMNGDRHKLRKKSFRALSVCVSREPVATGSASSGAQPDPIQIISSAELHRLIDFS
ncbi:hypothetical protein HDV63DRAFT_360409 [Trichoderma sp. SZMC 28014]